MCLYMDVPEMLVHMHLCAVRVCVSVRVCLEMGGGRRGHHQVKSFQPHF